MTKAMVKTTTFSSGIATAVGLLVIVETTYILRFHNSHFPLLYPCHSHVLHEHRPAQLNLGWKMFSFPACTTWSE